MPNAGQSRRVCPRPRPAHRRLSRTYCQASLRYCKAHRTQQRPRRNGGGARNAAPSRGAGRTATFRRTGAAGTASHAGEHPAPVNGARTLCGITTVSRLRSFALCALAVLVAGSLASAQQVQRITPNFKDADITQIAEAVSRGHRQELHHRPARARAGDDAVLDADVAGGVLRGVPVDPAGARLRRGACRATSSRSCPTPTRASSPSIDLPDHVSSTSDEIVTQVIEVKNVSAAQLVPILRPLIPQYGHLAAYPASQHPHHLRPRQEREPHHAHHPAASTRSGDQDVEIVPLQNASATEVVRVVNSLYQGRHAAEGAQRQGGRRRALQQRADQRREGPAAAHPRADRASGHAARSGGDTRGALPALRRRREARAEAQGADHRHRAGRRRRRRRRRPPATPLAQAEQERHDLGRSDQQRAGDHRAAKIMRAVMDIIDKLDIRRAAGAGRGHHRRCRLRQGRRARRQLGRLRQRQHTSRPAPSSARSAAPASSIWPARSQNPRQRQRPRCCRARPSASAASRQHGIELRGHAARDPRRHQHQHHRHALGGDHGQPGGELKVAQEVPFVTGQYTNTSAVTGGAVNPFQTIQREEVGTILKVTPHLNEGDGVMLKIDRELEHRPEARRARSISSPTSARQHQRADRGRRHRGARRPDRATTRTKGEHARAVPRQHSDHRPPVQDAQRTSRPRTT